MRALFLLAALAAADDAVSDKERAEADASAVLSAVLRTLETAAATDRALDERFGAWCDSARIRTTSLADEISRQVSEAETANEQLAADQDRLRSERGLAQAARHGQQQQQDAAEAVKRELAQDGKDEDVLLQQAQELANHALRLVRNREAMRTPSADSIEAADDVATKATALQLPELLTELLTEVDQQRADAQSEQDRVAALYDNVTKASRAASEGLDYAVETVGTEGQERSRNAARFASVLADLRRLVTAVAVASNATDQVCMAERDFARSRDGVDAAEMDAVRTVLESLAPPPATFMQLFLARSAAREGLRSRFHDYVARIAQDSVASPAFAKAAADLAGAGVALATKEAKRSTAHTAAEALKEIADFSAPDEESEKDTKVADAAYRELVYNIKRELTDVAGEGVACRHLLANASEAVALRSRDVKFAGAQLHSLNTTTSDLDKDAKYLDGQLKSLRAVSADFSALAQLEAAESNKLTADLRSFSQQLLTVATELAGASEKKVGSDVEALVAQLQQHLNGVSRRHQAYQEWAESVDRGSATLARVLSVDLAHARHKLQSYATDTTYLAAMERAKKRDEALAAEQTAAASARCPPEQEAVRRTRTAALEEQLREVTSFWTSLHV